METKEKIGKKQFEAKVASKFKSEGRLSRATFDERQPDPRDLTELINVKVHIYYVNNRHIASWVKGVGKIF